MHARIAAWLCQVKDATGFLKRLYVSLKDHTQRDRAEAAGTYAREHTRPSGGTAQTTPRPWLGLPSEAAERVAWICTIHGLLGLNILVALGDSSTAESQTSALHKQLDKELTIAIRGFATAFPSELVEGDLDVLCERVIDEAVDVAETAWTEVRKVEESNLSLRDFLKNEWLKDIKLSLRKMAESV